MKIKKIILTIVVVLILVPVVSIFYFVQAISKPCGQGEKNFVIKPGLGVDEISYNLEKKGIICDSLAFEIYLWLKKSEGKIKAGEYIFNNPLNVIDLTRILIAGQKNKEKEIKIIEGWNINDIAEYLDENSVADKNDFLNFTKNFRSELENGVNYDFLVDLPKGHNLEGFLFPDTYRIYEDSEIEDVAIKLLDNFDKKLTKEMRLEIEKQNKSIFEIITMASVIQKEVRTNDDMAIVSGIFWDRIKYGQPLESCATIGFILGENKRQYSYNDTRIKSSYNTYLNKGLPLGPICNPGFQAIKAAIYPEFTEYNYFLSSTEGKTIFSKTFKEHELNQFKYLK